MSRSDVREAVASLHCGPASSRSRYLRAAPGGGELPHGWTTRSTDRRRRRCHYRQRGSAHSHRRLSAAPPEVAGLSSGPLVARTLAKVSAERMALTRLRRALLAQADEMERAEAARRVRMHRPTASIRREHSLMLAGSHAPPRSRDRHSLRHRTACAPRRSPVPMPYVGMVEYKPGDLLLSVGLHGGDLTAWAFGSPPTGPVLVNSLQKPRRPATNRRTHKTMPHVVVPPDVHVDPDPATAQAQGFGHRRRTSDSPAAPPGDSIFITGSKTILFQQNERVSAAGFCNELRRSGAASRAPRSWRFP